MSGREQVLIANAVGRRARVQDGARQRRRWYERLRRGFGGRPHRQFASGLRRGVCRGIPLEQRRGDWELDDAYVHPGAIQYFGPPEVTDSRTRTLLLERAPGRQKH